VDLHPNTYRHEPPGCSGHEIKGAATLLRCDRAKLPARWR